jgi:hypothetical protein
MVEKKNKPPIDPTASGIERREHPRLYNNIPLKISREDGKDVVTKTVNISRAGAYCQIDQYIEPMTKLKLNLLVPQKKAGKANARKVVCTGVVVRTEPDTSPDSYNIAIFFSDITKRDAEVIADFIAEMMNQQP